MTLRLGCRGDKKKIGREKAFGYAKSQRLWHTDGLPLGEEENWKGKMLSMTLNPNDDDTHSCHWGRFDDVKSQRLWQGRGAIRVG